MCVSGREGCGGLEAAAARDEDEDGLKETASQLCARVRVGTCARACTRSAVL